MGVLSLLDSRPWSEFVPKWRGELAEISEEIVEELDRVVEALTDAALRTTPLLDRDSVVNGAFEPRYSNSYRQFSTGKAEPEFMPSGLQYQPRPLINARYPINTNTYFSYNGEPTPPSSAESNSNSWFDKPQSYGKNYEQLCEDPIWPERRVFEEKYAYRCSSPRPYSGSDITSLRPPPFNSPDVSFEGADSSRLANFNMSDRQFYELSDADCAENVTTSGPANTSLEAQGTEDLSTEGLISSQTEAPRGLENTSLEAHSIEDLSTEGLPSSQTEAPRGPDDTTLEAQRTEDLSTKGLSSQTEAPRSPASTPLQAESTPDLTSSQNEAPHRPSSTSLQARSSPDLSSPHTEAPHGSENTSVEAQTGDLSSSHDEQPRPANISLGAHRTEDISSQTETLHSNDNTSLKAQNTGDLASSQAETSRQKSMSMIEQSVVAIATQCGFDVVYCVELKVNSSLAPNDATMRYQMVYGYMPVIDPSTKLHLKVLRSGGCMHWQDIRETYERDHFADGYLIRLHPETPYENGSIGLVWGLFRKGETLESQKERDSEQEKQLVIAFAAKVATIIPPTPDPSRKKSKTGIPSQNTIDPQPSGQQSYSEPIGSQPFLANEATEVVLTDETAPSGGVSESSQKSANVEGASQASSTGQDSECQLDQTDGNDFPQHMPPTSRKNSAGITNKFRALTRGALTALGKGGIS